MRAAVRGAWRRRSAFEPVSVVVGIGRCMAMVACVALTLSCAAEQHGSGVVDYEHLPGYNYEETKVPPYTLIDPLRLSDGTAVTTATQWWTSRRPQIVQLLEDNVYGRVPEAAEHARIRVADVESRTVALGGSAYREQVDLVFGSTPAPGSRAAWRMRILLYVPVRAKGPVPTVFGMNFDGNQSVVDDPGIRPTPLWSAGPAGPAHAHSGARGSQSAEWQVKTVLSRGYGLATAYYQDVEPDAKEERANSIRAVFDTAPSTNSWGAVAAWAWGYREAVTYLQSNPAVDAKHIAVTGHSRLGKAADWAAAIDPNIAALLSTESGHGGQTIQRRKLGETVEHLADEFGYWFSPAYAQWVGHDQEIPADGNLLLSLVAPRPLYVASAAGDRWSDPRGEFLSARSAAGVYRLLGATALPPNTPMPPVDHPIGLDGEVAYHIRTGKHDVTAFDWQHYLDFLDTRWRLARN